MLTTKQLAGEPIPKSQSTATPGAKCLALDASEADTYMQRAYLQVLWDISPMMEQANQAGVQQEV